VAPVSWIERSLRRLGLTQPPAPVEPDQRVADEDAPGRPVDVAPAQPEQLALPHPGRDRQGEEGFERMAARLGQEAPGLVGAERPHLRPAPPRQGGAGRRVALDEPPGDRLVEGAVEDGVGVAQRRRRAGAHHRAPAAGVADRDLPRRRQPGVRAGDVLRRQRRQRDRAEPGHELAVDDAAVALEAGGPELGRRDIGQPALEEITDGEARIADYPERGAPDRVVAFGRRLARPGSARRRGIHRATLPVGVDVAGAPAALRRDPSRLLAGALVTSHHRHGPIDDSRHQRSSRAAP
jgi:hypothetical protein